MPASMDKQIIRKQALSARNRLSAEERRQRSIRVCERIIRYLAACGAGQTSPIMAYMPHKSEVDITCLLQSFWREGQGVLLPRTKANSYEMEACLTYGYADLAQGQWGIWEPGPNAPRWDDNIPCILVPGVAFDAQGARIGYGAGFYDRFLLSLLDQGRKLPVLVGIAYDVQIVERIPAMPHDIPMSMIVTESRMWCINEA